MLDEIESRNRDVLHELFIEAISNIAKDQGLNSSNSILLKSLLPEKIIIEAAKIIDNRQITTYKTIDGEISFYHIRQSYETVLIPSDVKWCSCSTFHRICTSSNPNALTCEHLLATYIFRSSNKTSSFVPLEELEDLCNSVAGFSPRLNHNTDDYFDPTKIY